MASQHLLVPQGCRGWSCDRKQPAQGLLPTDPLTQPGCAWPQTHLHMAQPFWVEAENTSLCFWKSPSSPAPSSLTFLPPLRTPSTAQRPQAQLSQLQILLPGRFTALPGHHQPRWRALSSPCSPFHFPRPLLFIAQLCSGEECSLSRGKGCCCRDSAG